MKNDENMTIAELKAKKSYLEGRILELTNNIESQRLQKKIIREDVDNHLLSNEEGNKTLMDLDKIIEKQQSQLMTFLESNQQLEKPLQKHYLIINELQKAKILHIFDLRSKQIKNIDLSQLPNLKQLNLSYNQLKDINLSNNTTLQKINLQKNHIRKLDLTANKNIVDLLLSGNQLLSININNNTKLRMLNLTDNRLRNIDLTNNIQLRYVIILNNSLVNIDLTSNIHLDYLLLTNNKLTNIDLKDNNKLKILNLANNNLKSIDLKDKKYLQGLNLNSNRLKSINLTNNINLQSLDLSNNCLKSIDLKNNKILKALKVHENNITMISLTNNPELKNIQINQNQLQSATILYNSQLSLRIQNQYVSQCQLTMLCGKEEQYNCRKMIDSLEGVTSQYFDIRFLAYQGNYKKRQRQQFKLEKQFPSQSKQIQQQYEEELMPQIEKTVNNLKLLKQHLYKETNFRKLINQLVSNLTNYESFIPNDNINVYTLLQNQKRNINILKKYDLGKTAIVQKQIQNHFTIIAYKEQKDRFQHAIYNYWKELQELIVSKSNQSNVKQRKKSDFQIILDHLFQDKPKNQIQTQKGQQIYQNILNQKIYRRLFVMSIKEEFRNIIINLNVKRYNQQKKQIMNSFGIYQSLITHQSLNGNDDSILTSKQAYIQKLHDKGYKVRDQINFNEQTLQIAKKLKDNNDLVSNLQGLYGVQEIDKSLQSDLMIHFKSMDIHRTAIFAQFNPKEGKQLLYRLLLPKNKNNVAVSEFVKGKQQIIKFTQQNAQDVVKKFIRRIKTAFINAAKKQIKVSLVLLRHLILDLNFNKQNYPNPLPYLNILQAFIDANNPNSKQQNFVTQFCLNQKIKRLNLDYYSHNRLICTIFLLSLVNKKSQRQFLNEVYQFLHEKSSRNQRPEKMKQTLFQQLCNHIIKTQNDHRRFYIDNVQSFDMKGIIINFIRQEVRDNLDDFEQAEALFREIIQQQEPQRDFISIKSSYVIGINGINQPLKYYYKIVYKMNNVQNATQQQRRAATDLFNITYSNYIYLWQKFRNIVPGQIIKPIRPVLYVLLIQQRCMQPNQHFMVLFPFQGAPNFILKKRQRSYYQDYMDQPSIHNMLIKDKSEYFQSLPAPAQNRFIRNLFKIAEELRRLQIEPIILNLAEIAFIQQNDNIYQLEEIRQIRPVLQHLTFFRVVHRDRIVVNNQAFTRIFGHLPRNHEIFTQNCPLNVWNNQYYSKVFNGDETRILQTNQYHIGSLGFALCLLLYRKQQQERRGNYIIQFDRFQRDYISKISPQGNLRHLDVDQLLRLLRNYTYDEAKIQFLKNVIHPDVDRRINLQEIQAAIASIWPQTSR